MSIQSYIAETRKSLDTLKYNFKNLKDSKPSSVDSCEHILDAMAHVKSSCREITQQVMERKRQAELKRKDTDDVNLTLQSFMYERNHY